MSRSIIVEEPLNELEADGNEEELNSLEQEVESNSFEIPDKFKDKSQEEIIKSYVELESRLGKQGSELGELRKLADDYIQQQLANNSKQKIEEDFEEEFDFSDPEKSVDNILSRHPAMQKLNELERKLSYDEFNKKHPNFVEVVQSEDFARWVKGSDYRKNLYVQADSHNYKAADELLTQWEERQELIGKAAEEEKKIKEGQRAKALNDATLESGSTGNSTKKKFRRADLIRLQNSDPEKYASMQDEIFRAYAEGNVI